MENCLASNEAFKSRYVKNPVIFKAVISGLIGIVCLSAVIGTVAYSVGDVAATKGWSGFVGNFSGLPLIGRAAKSYVAKVAREAAFDAIIKTLPISIAVGIFISVAVMLVIRKKTTSYLKGSGLDNLAKVVGNIVFLPLFAKYKTIIEESPDSLENAKEAAFSRIIEWGYKEEFATALIEQYFSRTSAELKESYDSILERLKKMKKNDTFDGIPKYELPPEGIQNIANMLENS